MLASNGSKAIWVAAAVGYLRPMPWYRRPIWQALGLFAFSFLLYANTLGHDYALDDAIVITDNAIVRRGPAGWGELFTHDTFYGFFGEERAALVTGGRYRPLTPAMFALERAVAPGPFLHHLLNVVWYGALGVVLLGMLREWWREAGLPWWTALAAAALFVAHPVHTEAVANIKGRDEIVALLGAAGAAWCTLRAGRRQSWGAASAGAVIFLLGCLAKENAITFAVVVPLLFYAGGRRGLRYTVPLLVAAVTYLAIRYAVIGWGGGAAPTELMNNPFLRETAAGPVAMNLWERLPTVCYTALLYLKLLVWPVGLVHDYYPASVALQSWSDPGAWLGLLTHALLFGWSLWHLRTRPAYLAAAVLLYGLTLSVVSNLLFPVGTLMSERFLFMPSLGFVTAIALLVARVKWGPWVLALFLPLCTLLTVGRNPAWQDNYTLFTTDVARQPRSAKLRNAAAGARLDRYQSLPEADRAAHTDLLDRSLLDLNVALRIHPRYGNAYLLRGNLHFHRGDYPAAIADYENALAYGTPEGTVNQNLALALQQAGRVAGEERNDLPAAIEYLQRSLTLQPDSYETLRLLGIAHGISGRTAEAVGYFERALTLEPDNPGAQQNLEMARQQLQAAPGG